MKLDASLITQKIRFYQGLREHTDLKGKKGKIQ